MFSINFTGETTLLAIILLLLILLLALFIGFIVIPIIKLYPQVKDVLNKVNTVTGTINDLKSAFCDFLPTLPICTNP